MPRLTKSLPKYRKHRASGQAIVTLSGKDHYLGPYGTNTSKIEYDRLVGEWLANGRNISSPQHRSEITVLELCASYLRFAKGYYVKNGKQTDEIAGIKAAIRNVKQNYANVMADKFGPLSLESVRESMIADGKSRSYINNTINRIRRMFRWGVSKELIPVQVYQALATVSANV